MQSRLPCSNLPSFLCGESSGRAVALVAGSIIFVLMWDSAAAVRVYESPDQDDLIVIEVAGPDVRAAVQDSTAWDQLACDVVDSLLQIIGIPKVVLREPAIQDAIVPVYRKFGEEFQRSFSRGPKGFVLYYPVGIQRLRRLWLECVKGDYAVPNSRENRMLMSIVKHLYNTPISSWER